MSQDAGWAFDATAAPGFPFLSKLSFFSKIAECLGIGDWRGLFTLIAAILSRVVDARGSSESGPGVGWLVRFLGSDVTSGW